MFIRRYVQSRLYLLALVSLLVLPTSPVAGELESPAQPDNLVASQELTPEKHKEVSDGLVQFYNWTSMLPKELLDLQNALQGYDHEELQTRKLPELAADIRDLQWEVATGQTQPYLQRMQLDKANAALEKMQAKVNQIERSLTEDVISLSSKRSEWLANQKKYEEFIAQRDLATILPQERAQDLETIMYQALPSIDGKLKPALQLGQDIADLQARLQSVRVDLRHLDKKIMTDRLMKTLPTPLALEFYRQLEPQLFFEVVAGVKSFVVTNASIIRERYRYCIYGFLFFTLLCSVIARSGKSVQASSRWYPFATSPIATAIILSTVLFILFDHKVSFTYQYQLGMILNIFAILAVIRLVPKCIAEQWKKVMFIRLAYSMTIIIMIVVLEIPQLLMLLFVFSASLVALGIYLFQLKKTSQGKDQQFLRNVWGLLPLVVVISCLAGYDQLAIFFFTTTIASIGISLVIWILFHMSSGLLELLLKTAPSDLVRQNIPVIVRSVQPLLALLHIFLAVMIISVIWKIFPSLEVALTHIDTIGFPFAGLFISPSFFLTIFLVLYGASLFSRAAQALLLKEVLPRYHAEKGVQLSITRLVHYGILTIGFIAMLKILGFELHQLTILGGALGVGIGFGLQAIVNNFVSGLILLFERPVKVGDTVQVGADLGEVKNVGLRATTIQTFDNSEIVVPNADLVTGQVTNWTLAERKVRVRIPVGVAYGSDVTKVLEILKSCADTHPMVLNSPKPTALFLAFGASSLDFELRFWIPEYLDKMTATSELNQSIESEFALHNIEIPFPQADLHLRTVSETAANMLRGKHGRLPKKKDVDPPSGLLPGEN